MEDDKKGKVGRKATVATEENIDKAKQLFQEQPGPSMRHDELLGCVTEGFKKRIYNSVISEGGHFENMLN